MRRLTQLEPELQTLPEHLIPPQCFTCLGGVPVYHVAKSHVVTLFVRVVSSKNDVRFVLTPTCFVGIHVFCMLFVFIYVYWCSTRFLYLMMYVSLYSNTMSGTCGAETANTSGAPVLTPGF